MKDSSTLKSNAYNTIITIREHTLQCLKLINAFMRNVQKRQANKILLIYLILQRKPRRSKKYMKTNIQTNKGGQNLALPFIDGTWPVRSIYKSHTAKLTITSHWPGSSRHRLGRICCKSNSCGCWHFIIFFMHAWSNWAAEFNQLNEEKFCKRESCPETALLA